MMPGPTKEADLDPDCPFCLKFGGNHAATEWYDQSLLDVDDFTVIPGLGAQIPGYVLIVPRYHITSYAAIGGAAFADLAKLLDAVLDAVRKVFGSAIAFEHGVAGTSTQRACIDHAHIHVMTDIAGLRPILEDTVPFRALSAYPAIRHYRHANYFYFRDADDAHFVAVQSDPAPGQFLRRCIAQAIDRPDDWDYDVFPGTALMREVVARLNPILRRQT